MFQVLAAVSELERNIISERTKLKLRHLKSKGIVLGRPRKAYYQAVSELRAKGLSFKEIGRQLGCDRTTAFKVLVKGAPAVVRPAVGLV